MVDKLKLLFGLATALIVNEGVALADQVTISPVTKVEMKAVFGVVESRDVLPARARLGGTIVSLSVEAGSAVQAGDVLATIVDDKLALQLLAADANINSVDAQLLNASTELNRAKKLMDAGVSTKSALDAAQTQVDVLTGQLKSAQAAKAVLEQQTTEGKVIAPAAGRVLTVPVTKGSVVMPGEPVAQIASGKYYLRLALPERHAGSLKEGASVDIDGMIGATGSLQAKATGKVNKIYPEIQGGKVNADVEVDGLGDYFVGQRVLVGIPADQREVLSVPPSAIITRSGVDYVKLADPMGAEVPVVAGETFGEDNAKQVEILSGLAAGDKVIVP